MAIAKKTGGRKKKTASASTDKKKFNGKVFTKKGCSSTKTGAKSIAESARKSGSNARVVKATGGYCVYTRKSA